MTTARNIITRALQRAGVLTKTESPSADEAADGLSSLNGIISSWSNEGLTVFARTSESFTLTPGTGSYTIGSGQTFNTTRPNLIVSAFVRSDTTDYALSIITDEVYAENISTKSDPGIPDYLNDNGAYPYGTLKLYPVPDAAYTLHLLSEKPLSEMTLDSVVTLPAGWERALISNLAVELSPEYGVQVSQTEYAIAKDSKAALMRASIRRRPVLSYPGPQKVPNILTGY